MTLSLHGIGASKGVAIGKLYVVERGLLDVTERGIGAADVEGEVQRFGRALDVARAELDAVRAQIPVDVAGDIAAFIDTHLLMLDDSAITAVTVEHIRTRRCNAEWALKIQRDAIVAVFEAMDDAYLRTRKDDIDHVVGRVQRVLLAHTRVEASDAGALAGRVIFADDLTPADTVLMRNQGVAAFVTEYGGPNSHTAILARSLRIPAVVGLHGARPYLRDDEQVIVDGRQGALIIEPDERMLVHYRWRRDEIERIRTARRHLREAPVVSEDGEPIGLLANVELPDDVVVAREVGAGGVGLYRTEYLFMNRDSPPDEDEQFEAYRGLVDVLGGAPATIRSLDLGADKQVDGSRPGAPTTSNPALGLRAVRLCLKEQGLFRPQLRAILRASAHGPVRLMIPMLSSTQELAQVMQILERCRRELRGDGLAYDERMPVGAMIEVPAAAVCADIFARHLDFFSIGTNDLIQYTIAIDRIDDEVNYLYDPLHPAVLRLIRMTIRAGQRRGIPVAMCGEMAGDARYTRLLLGMGLNEFSVHPNALLEVKQAITESNVAECRTLTRRLMRAIKSTSRAALVEQLNRTLQLDAG